MNRPGMQAMMRQIETGLIKVVLIFKLERVLRSTDEWAPFRAFLKKHDCRLVSTIEGLSEDTPSGRLKDNLLVSVAEFVRLNTAEKVRAKMLAQAKRGLLELWPCGSIASTMQPRRAERRGNPRPLPRPCPKCDVKHLTPTLSSSSPSIFQLRMPVERSCHPAMKPFISALLILGACASLLAADRRSAPKRQPEMMRAGDMAPDFALHSPDGKQTVRLSDFRGKKPVVLIFGSYTCPPFRDVYPKLERLHADYGEQVAFFYVYIREAHAEDGWKMPRNVREGISIKDPKNMAERVQVAKQACAFFKTSIPGLVDTMDDATDRAYAAWPSRMFVVDEDGKLAVHGDPGPRGLRPAVRAIEAWLKQHAATSAVR